MCFFFWAHTRRCNRAGDTTCIVAAAASTTLSSRHVALLFPNSLHLGSSSFSSLLLPSSHLGPISSQMTMQNKLSNRNTSSYLYLSDENNSGSLGHSATLFPVAFFIPQCITSNLNKYPSVRVPKKPASYLLISAFTFSPSSTCFTTF